MERSVFRSQKHCPFAGEYDGRRQKDFHIDPHKLLSPPPLPKPVSVPVLLHNAAKNLRSVRKAPKVQLQHGTHLEDLQGRVTFPE
jgi:hypothetical protein|eukprot:5371167-Prymnesium_polylepis.1